MQKHPSEVFYKKAVIKNFAKFAGKHLLWSLVLIKWQSFRPETLLKRYSSTGVFSVNFAKFFENTCFEKHLQKVASVNALIKFVNNILNFIEQCTLVAAQLYHLEYFSLSILNLHLCSFNARFF